ncbi:MAG: methyltransferase domain-containing protein [Pyrinomonadaceae bacterium]|nr:methyltransferase domain-containing protein [Pyrinomonadaceae bacterium]
MSETQIERNCDLCGSAEKRLIKTENEYPISRCVECGLVYVSRIPRVDQGKVIGEYYSGSPEEIEAGRIRYQEVSKYLLEEIAKVNPKKGDLLDVGCGYGFFLAEAQKSGWNVYGSELSHVAVDYMKTTQKLENVWFADLSDDDFPIRNVDVINMTNVLEHVPSPTKTLEDCSNLLNANGVLLVRVPNMEFNRVKEAFVPILRSLGLGEEGEFSYLATPPPIHLTGFSAKTLRKIFKKTGFRTIEIKPSKLSSRAQEHFLYRIFELSVRLLYKVSFHRINLSPTVLAIATRSK